ncbi:MAG: SufD family Fe-S cluster assembly protein [Deltaproteobacteria bacterium]|nr:SufD family Fe-S cluster assembly protein [Deltaproteobacteria bacterium]MBW2152266.1 SufD family Fe-S cluster assembly protein [Deltaproteobacteria bacterium]
MSELDELMTAFGEAGGDRGILGNQEIAHLVAGDHKILSAREIDGIKVQAKETLAGLRVRIIVKKGVTLRHPVHTCFGILHRKGTQKVKMDIRIEEDASASFVVHCVFPRAERIKHIMDARVEICEGAHMSYSETHFHGLFGGISVVPKSVVKVGRNGKYFTDFTLIAGRVGSLGIDYRVDAGENAVAELAAKVFGHADDRIKIKEQIVLAGENARGLVKTRVALEDEALAEITGVSEGKAAGARGHVDCLEIVKDNATAKAIPIVNVTHPLAKVTHEAAIGSVDKRQMETLMAHGLTPEEAVETIIKGVLR